METLPRIASELPSIHEEYSSSPVINTEQRFRPTRKASDAELSNPNSDGVTWEQLIERLLEIFESEEVNVDEVEELLSAYHTNKTDWKQFAKFDKYKYTRNLVHSGNGKFNLMLLCWAPGNQSSIHDHADAHCFVKNLDGTLKETRYSWPEEELTEDGAVVEKGTVHIKPDDVTYMCDELGLHRVENSSHSNTAVSLHLYSPPFQSCQMFDERTGKSMRAPMTFWSKYGEKIHRKKSERMYDVVSTAD